MEYLFPYEHISKGSKVILCGIGKVGLSFLHQIEMTHYVAIIGIYDRKFSKGYIGDIPLIRICDIKNMDYDKIIIAVESEPSCIEIQHLLVEHDIENEKIIWGNNRKMVTNPYAINRDCMKYHREALIDKTSVLTDAFRMDFRVSPSKPCVRVKIGANSLLGCNLIFESSEGHISIGNNTYIGGGTNIISRESIEIGNDVTISCNVWIYDHNSHALDWQDRSEDTRQAISNFREGKNSAYHKNWMNVSAMPVRICNKAWIGFNVIILKGVTIGEGAVVGAGSVVTKNVSAWTLVAGNPAKEIKKLVCGNVGE